MAATGGTPIILYHSTTGAAVPSNTNLAAGELGLNIADMKLYCENDSAVVTLLASADAAAGNFTTVDTTNIEVTNLKAKDGTAAGSIADSTGVVTLASSVLTTTDINGGSIDAVTLGTNSPVTEAQIDNININGNAIVSSDTNGSLSLTPNGTGDLILDGLKWPQADGSADYVLKTNGSGQLSWTAQTGGGGGGGTSVTVTQYTATASQTTFSVTYTVGQLSVYLNGALLASSDYTATNGTSVVLASGAASGDIFTAVAYDSATQITEGDSSVEVTDTGSNGTATFTMDGTVRAKVNAYGIGLGTETPSSGMGIKFPVTQSASSDANTLDDYEEGTFTPDLKFGGNAVSLTYSSRGGRYTKIGRCVTVSFYFVLSNKGTSTGLATVSLPFSSDEYGQPNQPGYAGGFPYYSGMTDATKAGFIVGNIGAAGYVMASTSTTAAGYVATESNFNNNTVFAMTITYNTST